MKTFLFSPENGQKEFKIVKKFFASSFLLHALIIFSILFFGSVFDFGTTIELPAIEAKLVKLGKERNKRLLPRIVKNKPTPKAAPKDSKGNTLKKPKPKKKITKKKPPKQKRIKKESLDDLLGAAMQDVKVDKRAEETDEGSKDGVEEGDVTDPALAIKGNMYIRQISAIIKKNWKIPTILTKDTLNKLQTTIFFRITFSGDVYNITIVEASDNNVFDSSVIEAIKRTGKLPLPKDKKLKKVVLKEGLEWNFTPKI